MEVERCTGVPREKLRPDLWEGQNAADPPTETEQDKVSSSRRPELLTKVFEASGGIPALSRALSVSRQAIYMWKEVPTTKVLAVEEISGIRREILRPDRYDEQGQLCNETTREKLVKLADGTRSAAELAQLCGVSRQRVHQLLIELTSDGSTVPVKSQKRGPDSLLHKARAHGLYPATVRTRLKKGMSLEEALAIPPQPKGTPRDPNSINGQARAHGLTPNIVHQRVRTLGWPLERALTTPPRRRRAIRPRNRPARPSRGR